MTFSCDICGENKPCLSYKCTFGDKLQYTDYLHLCADCVEIQRKEGPVEYEPPDIFATLF